ncbi:MAG TPA: VanZ family protein, partial [Verrucomicrobiota bacterium]|nr:VanZ family protein [Verrucomicrobiota bacterium]
MPLIRLLLKYWVPVLLWMALIFSASGDTKSYDRSSRIIAPLVRLLFPSLSEGAVDRMVLVARKGAHVTEYAVLAVLCWYAIRRPVRSDPRPWSWRQAGIAFL